MSIRTQRVRTVWHPYKGAHRPPRVRVEWGKEILDRLIWGINQNLILVGILFVAFVMW